MVSVKQAKKTGLKTKKSKKAKQPLWVRVIKFILIALSCAILLAAMVERTIHFFRRHT